MSKLDDNRPVLSSYLQPPIAGPRLERNRAAVFRRLERRAAFGGFGVAAIAACAAALVFVAWGPLVRLTGFGEKPTLAWQVTQGSLLEAQQEPLTAALQDGTRIELSTTTTLAGLPAESNEVELELRRGRASFDVTHDPSRQFRVHAGDVTVVVLGTRFSVERRAGTVSVAVERGKVAVERGSELAYLTPGQRWQGSELHTQQSTTPGQGVPSQPDQANTVARGTNLAAPSHSASDDTAGDDTAVELATTEPTLSRATAPAAKPNGSEITTAEVEAPSPAKQLFDASREARRVGDSRRAAQLLQQLVAQYPGDPRAGLAAFELGRIRSDVLGDVTSAISALEQALRLSPQGSFRQDALARLAQAYDRTGQVKACKATRQRYLAAYGEGVHAQRVLKLCP